MWFFLIIIMLFSFVLRYLFRRNSSPKSKEKVATCPGIDTLTFLVFYIPIFLVKGLVPAILVAREYYGLIFCLKTSGIKRRIFFITELHGRNTISNDIPIRLPAAQVAQVFDLQTMILLFFLPSLYKSMKNIFFVLMNLFTIVFWQIAQSE
jgi:hypothetical protein